MKRPLWVSIYANRRMAALLGLGFAAGLPSAYKLLGSTLQAWLLDAGVDLTTVGFFSLVSLPFAFNFVWAPLLDRFAPDIAGLGRRRSWMLVIQLLLVAAIAVMGLVGPSQSGDSLLPLTVACMVMAFFAASQDVVVDAYRTDVLPARQRGAGAAVYVNGYRIGMLMAGGGALMLSRWLDWSQVYLIMAGCMGLGVIATWLAPEPPTTQPPTTIRQAVIEPVMAMVRRDGWKMPGVLLFVVLFKLPDALAGTMTMPLLRDGLQWRADQIAYVREWGGLGAIMIGALVGGWIVARWPLRRCLWLFGILQAVSNLGLMILALSHKSLPLFAAVVGVESFCAGLVTAGFIAFLMSRCDPRYSATQYALFTSLMYASGALLGSITGMMVEHTGYALFFLFTLFAAVPGLAVLWWISPMLASDEDSVSSA